MEARETTEIVFPYGKSSIPINIPTKNLIGVARSTQLAGLRDENAAINDALNHPINSLCLEQMISPGNKVCIIVDDITRPTPTSKLLPPLLERLHSCGLESNDITIIIATGMHSPATFQEMRLIIGPEISENYNVISHNAANKEEMVYVGKSKSGNSIWINRHVIESDLKILIGYVRPHPIFGYTGGRKSIVPGVADEETNKYNHRPEWVCHNPYCDYLNLENNPSHEDAVDIARRVKVDFILNVVLNEKKELVKVVAGELVDAWLEATEVVKRAAIFEINELADIVISSPGPYPDDINLYQALPYAIASRKHPVFKNGATMLLVAQCREGLGNEHTFDILQETEDFLQVIERLEKRGIKRDEHSMYAFAYFSLRYDIKTMAHTEGITKQTLKRLKIAPVVNLNQTIANLLRIYGPNARILAIPNSKNVIVRLRG
jgi:nickel-dependent lactate racemase